MFPDDPLFQDEIDNTTTTTSTNRRMINTYPDESMNEISDEKSSYKQHQSYPTGKIVEMLNKSRSDSRLNSYFETPEGKGSILTTRIGPVQEDSPRGRSRIGDDEWANLCHETTSYQYPKLAKNTAGVPRYVVNSDGADELSEYRQKVKMTRCDGSTGNQEDDDVIHGNGGVCETLSLVTGCRQEYADHKLVAVDEDGKELIVDTFRFPSGCTCVHNISFLDLQLQSN